MRQKSWNQFKKTMAASTLAGAIAFTGCAVMPSVTAFADTTEQTGQVSYDNEVMPIHTDVQTEEKPLMKGTSCTVSDGKNLYYAFEMMGVRMGIMKYNTKTGKKSEVYSYKIGKNKKGSNGFSQLSVDKKYIYATWDRYYGTDATKEYVYRIAKDGKSAKKLALGRDPQLIDGRIYYLALKSKSEDGMNYSEDTGTVMSMKTDGTQTTLATLDDILIDEVKTVKSGAVRFTIAIPTEGHRSGHYTCLLKDGNITVRSATDDVFYIWGNDALENEQEKIDKIIANQKGEE